MLTCFSQSTAHGLAHIGNEPTYFGKFIWFFLTIATFVIFGGHTYSLYTQFIDEQVFIATRPNAVPFIQPDVIFCSERIFARDYINNPPEKEYEYMLNVSKSIQKFDAIYQKWKYKSSKIIWDSLNFSQLYKAFYHRKSELFLNITCNFISIDVNELKIEMSLTHFACYRLPANVCRLDSPFNSLIVKFYVHIYGKNINYTSLNVNIDNRTVDSYVFIQKEYVDEVADGVHVYFVQPNEAAHDRTTRVLAGANTQTDIRIKSTKIVRQSNRKSNCQELVKYDQFFNLLEENIRLNYLNYTENSLCLFKEFQYIFFRTFKCVSKLLPIPVSLGPDVTFCGDLHTQKEYISVLYSKITSGGLYQVKTILNKCEGSMPCSTVKYQATVNYNRWPWAQTLKRLLTVEIPEKLIKEENISSPGLSEAVEVFKSDPTTLLSWRKNFFKVSISSDEFMSTLVEESPSYSLKNFFSDVGGIMGFYMGASLLTVCELFRVIYFTLYSMWPKRRKNEEAEEHSLNDVKS